MTEIIQTKPKLSHAAYETDFAAWLSRQLEFLREGRFQELDIDHLIEEIDDMGKSLQRELASRLRVVLLHLLMWQYQTQRRSSSWRITLNTQRAELELLLEQSPSLRPRISHVLESLYSKAHRDAAAETGLPIKTFPVACPYSEQQLLEPWFPNSPVAEAE